MDPQTWYRTLIWNLEPDMDPYRFSLVHPARGRIAYMAYSTATQTDNNSTQPWPRRTTTQLNRDPDGQRLNSTVTWTENTSTVTSMSQNKEPRRTTTQLNCDPGGQQLNSTVTQADNYSTQPWPRRTTTQLNRLIKPLYAFISRY